MQDYKSQWLAVAVMICTILLNRYELAAFDQLSEKNCSDLQIKFTFTFTHVKITSTVCMSRKYLQFLKWNVFCERFIYVEAGERRQRVE